MTIQGRIPRRNQINLLTKEELAIIKVMQEVEKLGADPLLTEVIDLLSQAREKLADFVDK